MRTIDWRRRTLPDESFDPLEPVSVSEFMYALGRRAFLRRTLGASGAMFLASWTPFASLLMTNPTSTNVTSNATVLAQAPPASVTLKFAYANLLNHPVSLAAEQVSKMVAEKTNGRIKIELFPGGQLGSIDEMLSQVSRNTIQLHMANPPILSRFSSKIGVFAAPFLFPKIESVYKAAASPVGQAVLDELRTQQNMRVLSAWYLGSWNIMATKRPVRKADDLKGMKLRIPPGPVLRHFLEQLGASPVPMDYSEVYLALKTGLIDGIPIPFLSAVSAKFYEVTKHATILNFLYDIMLPLINEAAWRALSAEDQKIIADAFQAGRTVNDKFAQEQEASALKVLTDNKVEIESKPDVRSFMAAAERTWARFESDWGGREQIQRLRDAGR